MERMHYNPLQATIAALEDTLRRAELRHKALVASLNASGYLRAALQEDVDWVPFYAKYLAEEFAGIRLPGLPTPVPASNLASDSLNDERVVRNEEAVKELTAPCVGTWCRVPEEDESGNNAPAFSNRKWEPRSEEACTGYSCE